MEAQGLHAAKNGYCPLTQCTVHIKNLTGKNLITIPQRLRDSPLIKLHQNHTGTTLTILNCSKLDLFCIPFLFRLQCRVLMPFGHPNRTQPIAFDQFAFLHNHETETSKITTQDLWRH